MKDPYSIIIKPHITEKSVAMSYGDPNVQSEEELRRSYTFIVAPSANKIEIKQAVETIYNAGKKAKEEKIKVARVRTMHVRGKTKKVGMRSKGKKPDFKKAIITLAPGQILEDYGV